MTSIVAEMNQKLDMVRGDTATWQGQMINPDDNSIINLNSGGISLWFTVKRSYDDDDLNAVIQKTIGHGITVLSGTGGLFQVTVLPVDTSVLDNELTGLVFDMQMVDASGNKTTPARGTLLVYAETTTS